MSNCEIECKIGIISYKQIESQTFFYKLAEKKSEATFAGCLTVGMKMNKKSVYLLCFLELGYLFCPFFAL